MVRVHPHQAERLGVVGWRPERRGGREPPSHAARRPSNPATRPSKPQGRPTRAPRRRSRPPSRPSPAPGIPIPATISTRSRARADARDIPETPPGARATMRGTRESTRGGRTTTRVAEATMPRSPDTHRDARATTRDTGTTTPGYRGDRARYQGNDARYPGKSTRDPGDDARIPGSARAVPGRRCPATAASPRIAGEIVPGHRTRPTRSPGKTALARPPQRPLPHQQARGGGPPRALPDVPARPRQTRRGRIHGGCGLLATYNQRARDELRSRGKERSGRRR